MPNNTITKIGPSNSFDNTPDVSFDGRFVAFETYAALALGDLNDKADIYLIDMQDMSMRQVSLTQSGVIGKLSSFRPSLSDDGKLVAFDTWAKELSGMDVTGVLVKDMVHAGLTGAMGEGYGQPYLVSSAAPSLSADGHALAFLGTTLNLVSGQRSEQQILLKNLESGKLALVSTSANGVPGNASADHASLSADGRYVAFDTGSDNLMPTNFHVDNVFVKDMLTGILQCASSNVHGETANHPASFATLAGNGRYVVFSSSATNLVPSGDNGQAVYWKDMLSGEVALVSCNTHGVAANGISDEPSVSADGRFVVFQSSASNLVDGDTNGQSDIFLKDMATGAIWRVNLSGAGVQADNGSAGAAISGDGKTVVFISKASNLVPGDGNGSEDVFYVSLAAQQSTAANTLLTGSAGSDHLQAPSGNSTVNAGAGDDLIVLGAADALVDGGSGRDTVVMAGARASFQIAANGIALDVQDTRPGHGANVILTGVERLLFDDAAIAYDIDGHGGQAYRVFQAAFNRVPDAAGLGFWIGALDGGASLQAVADGFAASTEFKQVYGATPSNGAILSKFYENVLHRGADPGGYAFWLGVLDAHAATTAEVLASFSESPENQAGLIGTIGHGFAYLPVNLA